MSEFYDNEEVVKDLLVYASDEALSLGHYHVGCEHIILAALNKEYKISTILGLNGLNYLRFRNAVIAIEGEGDFSTNPSYSQGVRQIIKEGKYIDDKLFRGNLMADGFIFRAVVDRHDIVPVVLTQLNFDVNNFISDVKLIFPFKNSKRINNINNVNNTEDDEEVEESNDSHAYLTNLVEMASENLLDPVIGRDTEIARMIEILSRRTKNNPVLIGEPGVGKTAICEGLAQKIVKGDVPYYLKKKKIFKLDLTAMVAGTRYRGDFEERIKSLLDSFSDNRDAILFIDELHLIVGAGSAEGSLDASNILKPYLERGGIQVIGATTTKEYRKYIEKDTALERRFQKIIVKEPDVNSAIEILKGLKGEYESHHKLSISDEAIEACVLLSKRYIQDRFLPDKAIDVMDEAMSKKRVKLKEHSNKKSVLQAQLDKLTEEKQLAVALEDYKKAAKIRNAEKVIEGQIKNYKDETIDEDVPSVSVSTIEEVVSSWSGVPINKLSATDLEKLRNFSNNLKDKIIGQDKAIEVIDRAIKRSRSGLKDPNRPIGSFLFVGPTGVGKTYLAKRIAYELFGDENKLTAVDMSEYMEKHAVSKLIGSPPGYVGFDDGGQLTELVRNRPYQVLLFDEIEKAHPDVFNVLLQILEEGRLTDSHGKEVDFKNTVVILTSNAGSKNIKQKNSYGFGTSENDDKNALEEKVRKALKELFRPEFLNRIDDIVVFNTLEKEAVNKIVRLEIDKIKDRIKKKFEFEVTDNFINYISKEGYSEIYGARPLKRALTKFLEDELSEKIVLGEIEDGDKLLVDYKDGVIIEKEEKNGEEE